ncbi:MAG: helix-turn-helix transcriptional regulator [Clostridia bacterium]|nr:helix-turn-helix transcriptional regulator [Clostridia bacterium]
MKIDFARSVVQSVDPAVNTNTLAVGHYHGHRAMSRPLDCLVMILTGSATYRTHTHTFTVRAGDVLFLSHGARYVIDVQEEYKHVWFDFMLTRADGGANECCGIAVTDAADVERIFQRLRRRNQDKSPSACMMRLSLVYELLAILAKEDVMDYISSNKRTRIEDARAFIDGRVCDETFSCRDIARPMGMSEVHFRRLFAKMYGQTPNQYLTSARMALAKEKLLRTDESIQQIARETGFGNQNYFSRAFRRETGMTPTDYRNSAY